MTVPEIKSNASILTIAGSETTATALSGATYFLLKNPAAWKKLATEVRSTFAREDEINLLSVGNLKYMLACLEETLRIYPPSPAALPRITNKRGDIINGKLVAGGVSKFYPLRSSCNITVGLTRYTPPDVGRDFPLGNVPLATIFHGAKFLYSGTIP
jgi:hypothetical protein